MDSLNFRSRFILLLTILIAPLAGVSAAGLIDLNTNVNGSVNTGASVNGAVRDAANINTNANVNTNVRAGSNASSNSSSTVNSNTNGSATVTTGREGGAEVSAGASGNVIRVDRSSDEVRTSISREVDAEQVTTDADLRSFVVSQIRSDENFMSADIGDEEVVVSYRQPARFLGILPMMMPVRVTVDAGGDVDIDYPWYSFLSLTNRADLEAAIESEVAAFLEDREAQLASVTLLTPNIPNTGTTTASSTIDASTTPSSGGVNMTGSAVFTPSVRASLVARIHAVLKSHLTNSSGNASSTQSVTTNR